MIQRHRLAGGQRGHHRGGSGRLDTQHRGVRRPLRQVGGDAGDATATTHRDHHHVGLAIELLKHLDGDGALTSHGARVVVRRHQRGAGALDVSVRGLGGQIVGLSPHDQLDELAAVIADPVTLLDGRLGRHIDPAVHAQRPARIREALRVVACRRAHHAGRQLLVGQLDQQVIGAAQLVRAHDLQVFALEVDLRAGDRRQPIAELQRGGRDHGGDPLCRTVNVGRGQCRQRRPTLAQFSGHRSMVPRLSSPASARTPESGGRSSSGTRRSRDKPRRRAPTRWPSRRRTPRGSRNRG